MLISDWSSDVCSSDLQDFGRRRLSSRLGRFNLLRLFLGLGRQLRHVDRWRIGGGIEAEHVGGAFKERGRPLDFALIVHVIVPRPATIPPWMNSATSSSKERRLGKECGGPGRSGGSPYD